MDDRERDLLARLAQACGIVGGYYDVWRNFHVTAPATQRRLLEAMGIRAGTVEELERELVLRQGREDEEAFRISEAPAKAYTPPAIEAGARLWGINLPLYGVRSSRNWGIGDFADLREAVAWAAGAGADFLGLLPLHALFNEAPYGVSPYYPSSRLFLNPVYLAVGEVSEAASPDVRAFLEAPSTRAEIERLRGLELVDYPGVWALKEQALRGCYEAFRLRGGEDGSRRREAFEGWQREQGAALEGFATFTALREHFESQGLRGSWQTWPEGFRRQDAPGVREFRERHPQKIEFHAYVQWHCHQQLRAAAALTEQHGMAVGLYLDLALGADPAGADAWMYQGLLALSASAGCPPDPFSLLGQKWGLPPTIPERHRAAAYPLLRETLRRNAAYAGALRIDHALALWRLFWVPAEGTPAEGAYVREKPEELLALLRQLSHERRCLVVGEDLGTIPPEVRDGLMTSGFYSYRVAIFERDAQGRIRPPSDYPRQALVSVSTHDLPTLDGFWLGLDLEAKKRLQRYPDEESARADREGRERDRSDLLRALAAERLLPPGLDPDREVGERDLDALAEAAHRFLARSSSALLLANLDDLVGEREMQNLPGTIDAHPNWRRKCSTPLERWPGHPRAENIARAIRAEGRGCPTIGS